MKKSIITNNKDSKATHIIAPNTNLQLVNDGKTITEQFPVLGMTCASCSAHVQKALSAQQGVNKASVNLANATAHIEYSPKMTSPDKLKAALLDAGYDLIIEKKSEEEIEDIHTNKLTKLKRNCIAALILCIPLVTIAMGFHTMPYANYIMWTLSTPIVLIFGAPFFIGAWKQLKHKTSNMDTLVALSTGIAYTFSTINTLFPQIWTSRGLEPHVYFEVAAVVIAFVLLGRYLEDRAKHSTSDAIKQLIGIQPRTATLVKEDTFIEIPISQIQIGDELVVKPGEKIAVDGKVIKGNSFIDESMINGEPLAIEKTIDAKVFAGTINQSGNFHYVAEKIGKHTLLAQIIKIVQEAQGSRAPIQKLVDKIASIFVPIIVITSILTYLTWMILGSDNNISQGLLSAITVLIIACPCALGLATPTAIMVGVGRGATRGILIKDAQALETAKKLTSIVLDKTGTITEGKPQVTAMKWFVEETQELRDILFSIEAYSEHPLAEAIKAHLANEAKLKPEIKVETLPGQGISGESGDNKYFIGNVNLINNLNISTLQDSEKWIEENTAKANTLVIYADNSKVLAAIAIADTIKETSIEAIAKLKAMGLKVHMLTGDNEQSAQLIAKQTGIEHVTANVLPLQKTEFIKSLQDKGEIVAMVGDGINDSGALATADISVAMGKGSDIAINVAQLTIMSSDLNRLSEAIKLSKATVQTIKQNLFWAFIYNIIGIPLAAGILYPINGFLLNPMIAGLAMALSSVCVVANSLLLKVRKI